MAIRTGTICDFSIPIAEGLDGKIVEFAVRFDERLKVAGGGFDAAKFRSGFQLAASDIGKRVSVSVTVEGNVCMVGYVHMVLPPTPGGMK